MTAASVGFQCPDCVAEGRASVPVARTRFGAVVPQNAAVSVTLVGICVALFALEFLIGIDKVANDFGMWPLAISLDGQWWRLFTSVFLHYSVLHILFNMYVLWVIGPDLERVLGHLRFLVLFVVAGFGGAVASYWLSPSNTVSVGASGAIFGLMGAVFVVGKALRADVNQVLVLIGINLAIGFVISGIDWRAHIGGLVTGAAVAAVMVFAPKAHRNLVQVAGTLTIIAVLVILTVLRTAQLQDQFTFLVQ